MVAPGARGRHGQGLVDLGSGRQRRGGNRMRPGRRDGRRRGRRHRLRRQWTEPTRPVQNDVFPLAPAQVNEMCTWSVCGLAPVYFAPARRMPSRRPRSCGSRSRTGCRGGGPSRTGCRTGPSSAASAGTCGLRAAGGRVCADAPVQGPALLVLGPAAHRAGPDDAQAAGARVGREQARREVPRRRRLRLRRAGGLRLVAGQRLDGLGVRARAVLSSSPRPGARCRHGGERDARTRSRDSSLVVVRRCPTGGGSRARQEPR